MKKRILTLAAAMMVLASASAVPARRAKVQVRQPDGTMLTIMRVGDENHHFTCTVDGMPVVKSADGAYCYARIAASGALEATGQVAHEQNLRTQAELAFLQSYETDAQAVRSMGAERRAVRNAHRVERLEKRSRAKASDLSAKQITAGAGGGDGIGVTGKRKGLVILVNFKDKSMLASHTNDEWNKFFNGVGYTTNGNSGSVHEYFSSQSYGQFDLDFDVVGPVTVSKNMASYGANDFYGDDVDPGGMVYEACKLADQYVDFADYDWDGDGEVDQVYVIYAGYGESSGTETNPIENTIWPHEWSLSAQNYSLRLDGVTIDTYACSSELNGNTGSMMDGIGTACHEFSHCLGIPDLYDTNYKAYGMGSWDLMDYGSYGGDGYKPVGYNTYERWVSGWLQPTELKEPCFVKDLKALSESPESYIIYNEKTPTEYYILENRQLIDFDTELPASGMLVIHVDYNKQVWENNTVNNVSSHQRLTIVPADNKLTDETEEADTYPGTTNNTSLTDTSKPAATLFNANTDGRKFLGKPVTDISERDGKISFTFMDGINIATPSDLSATEIGETGFTANWGAVENADSYDLQLKEKGGQGTIEESLLLGEDLTQWGQGFTGESTIDIGSSLDSHMKNPGWTGVKIFECPGSMKIGSSKVVGQLVSPLVSNPAAQSVTVAIVSKPYGNDVASTTISIVDNDENEIASQTIVPNGKLATVVLANPDGKDFKVMVKPKKRSYVMSVGVYDGSFTADDFDGTSALPSSVKSSANISKAANAAITQVDGVTATSYKFENLTPGIDYLWRVRAVSDGMSTSWSGWQSVVLGATAINQVFTALGGATLVDVCTLSGVSVGKMTCAEFLSNSQYRGAYILNADGMSVTVVK